MQRQTQSHELTLSVYLVVDVVDDSKQSKPWAVDHYEGLPICTHSRWWSVANGSGGHSDAACYCTIVKCALWQMSAFAMYWKIAETPARIKLLSLLPGQRRTSIYLDLMHLDFIFLSSINRFWHVCNIQRFDKTEGSFQSCCVCVCVLMCTCMRACIGEAELLEMLTVFLKVWITISYWTFHVKLRAVSRKWDVVENAPIFLRYSTPQTLISWSTK